MDIVGSDVCHLHHLRFLSRISGIVDGDVCIAEPWFFCAAGLADI